MQVPGCRQHGRPRIRSLKLHCHRNYLVRILALEEIRCFSASGRFDAACDLHMPGTLQRNFGKLPMRHPYIQCRRIALASYWPLEPQVSGLHTQENGWGGPTPRAAMRQCYLCVPYSVAQAFEMTTEPLTHSSYDSYDYEMEDQLILATRDFLHSSAKWQKGWSSG